MSKKLTKETVNRRIRERGLTLIGEYVNNATKALFRCSAGHEWNSKPNGIMNGVGCPQCAGLAPLSKDIVNERIKERGLTMIGEYENTQIKALFRCSAGHEWNSKPNGIMKGVGCPHCSNRVPLSKDIVNERIKERGLTMIGKYENSGIKALFSCSAGHEWRTMPAHVMKGSGCPHCAGKAPLTKDIVNGRIRERGLTVIGDYVNSSTKALFSCGKGHEWSTTPGDVMKGHGCPHCAGLAPLTKDKVNERIKERGLTMIGKYEQALTKALFRCSAGHEWSTLPSSIMRGYGCPSCAVSGYDNNKPGTLYYLKVTPVKGIHYYKIGITNSSVTKRFSGEELAIITVLLEERHEDGATARAKEKLLLSINKGHQYQGPDILTSGNTELFTADILGLDVHWTQQAI